jgi:hypothetical protein
VEKFDRIWRLSGAILVLAGMSFYFAGIAHWYAIWAGMIGLSMLVTEVQSAITLQMMRFFDWLFPKK